MSDKKRIFIVDDDQAVLVSLRKLLELSGFCVEVASDTRDIVSRIKLFNPHLILLDLLMPVLGGLEICEMLNTDRAAQAIPIIILSALGKEEDVKNAYRLGVVGYFTKPYDFNDVLREVNKTIASKEQR
ncbi:MAG: response regulator [Candidatus Omnitrophota bacterium]|nr:response regulator [Candidatus Omnitrophota bacterium]